MPSYIPFSEYESKDGIKAIAFIVGDTFKIGYLCNHKVEVNFMRKSDKSLDEIEHIHITAEEAIECIKKQNQTNPPHLVLERKGGRKDI